MISKCCGSPRQIQYFKNSIGVMLILVYRTTDILTFAISVFQHDNSSSSQFHRRRRQCKNNTLQCHCILSRCRGRSTIASTQRVHKDHVTKELQSEFWSLENNWCLNCFVRTEYVWMYKYECMCETAASSSSNTKIFKETRLQPQFLLGVHECTATFYKKNKKPYA